MTGRGITKIALCLVTGAIACGDSSPTGLALPLLTRVCDIEPTAEACPADASGSVTLEVLVVSVTPVP